ncbi:MAG: signal peptide peptidase SppA [Microcystaceae cyanobacterium]
MNKFFQQIFASLIGTLAAIALMTTLGVSGVVFLLFSFAAQDSSPKVEDKSFITFDLSTAIRDRQPNITVTQAVIGDGTNTITLRDMLTTLEKATEDDRIIGIFLDGRKAGLGNGYANLTEVQEALQRFKAAGKKIIAYDLSLSEKEYYIAALADKIILNPMGGMELNGVGSEQMFLTGAMDKYGIGVQILRVGNFKAAVEPYTRQDFSPENQKQLEALLGDIWASFLGTVSQNRQLSPAKLQNLAKNKGILSADEAKTAGLVDQVAYLDEVVAELQELTGQPDGDEKNTFRQISLASYRDVSVSGFDERSSDNKVAVVYAEGAIVNGEGELDNIGGQRFAKMLRKIRQDEEVKAVVIRINSPGGSASASDIIWREIDLMNQEKPVIVSMGNVAASGGYWIATGAKRIFAQTNTITGSIGVFGVLFNFQEIANNNGITWDRVQTSPLATLGSTSRPKSPAELAIFQTSVNRVYDLFLERVSQSRELSKTKVDEIAQGRVWSGKDAQKLGLVDEIGGVEAAIAYAIESAELGDDWEIAEYPENTGLDSLLLKASSGTETQQNIDPLTKEWLRLQEELEVIQSLNDPQGVYTRLPFSLNLD